MRRMFLKFLERLGLRKQEDFLTRVLRRHRENAPVSDFARELVRSETAETINERFAKVKQQCSGRE